MFGGLSSKLPYYYGLFAVAAFTSLGLPGLAGFWSEFFVFRGAFAIVSIWAAIGVIGLVLTAAYILWKIVQYVFLGETPHKIAHGRMWRRAELNEPGIRQFEKVTSYAGDLRGLFRCVPGSDPGVLQYDIRQSDDRVGRQVTIQGREAVL
jgi:formate hydrogenlyase subunit 3/multisubunit Na+/H+ antiporter MnhD subunit